jgi:hypothetical protein
MAIASRICEDCRRTEALGFSRVFRRWLCRVCWEIRHYCVPVEET